MEFKLPKVTTAIDCESVGYPGMTVTFWLNPTKDESWEEPEDPQPWDSPYYRGVARMVEHIFIPAKYLAGDADITLDLNTGKDVYDLEQSESFESWMVHWFPEAWRQARQSRYLAEVKNSKRGSGSGV